MSTYRNSGTTSTGEQTATQGDINDAVTASAASAAAALVSENNADASEIAAELAETNAETAQTAAELAETNAETAQTAAELAETNAETAETNASASETNAAASAVEAAASAAYTKDLTFPALADIAFPDIATSVAVSNIYEPFLESNWPLMMEDKSWYDEEGYGVDGVYHSTVTTTERDALTPAQGDVCYNSTTTQFEKYNGSAWAVTYRGNKREFPARAIAVAEAAKVIIYDLTESEPVMWVVFNGGGWDAGAIVQTAISSVDLRGGILSVGGTNDFAGLTLISFLTDSGVIYTNNAAYGGADLTPISDRNNSGHTYYYGSGVGLPVIVNNLVNDIATTQLDNAPIDEYGVKGVIWAVGTDGGVSVGRTDGNVWDITGQSHAVDRIAFNNNGDVITIAQYKTQIAVYNLPSSDIAYTAYKNVYSSANAPYLNDWHNQVGTLATNNGIASGNTTTGLTLIKDDMSNFIATDHQSGWQYNEIKGAWLSDNDDTNVTGSELVTNGDFGTALGAEWTLGSTNGVITAGEFVLNGADWAYQQLTNLVIGVRYTLTITHRTGTSATGSDYTIGTTDGGTDYSAGTLNTTTTNLIESATFVATSTDVWIKVIGRGDGTTIYDDISIRLADSDRSVNGNGLQVNGTITKTRLGGDDSLVAYTFDSNSKFLRQPFNADLDYGVNAFYLMGWVKNNGGAYLIDRKNTIDSNARFFLTNSSGQYRFSTYSPSGSASNYYSTSTTVDSGVWAHVVIIRNADGSVAMYIDSVLDSLTSGTVRDITDSSLSNTLTIGNNGGGSSGIDGDMALWRTGLGAPSEEDIEFIYKQEKPLIVNGADAVLGGASDAITAIAWDDYKNQLKVQSADYLTTIQGSTVIKKEASTATVLSVSDGEVAKG